ncbi:WD repeat-containing protein 43 [Thoreauomyces humboldtii]|nr:WD repeat-containing protein 43 [Thoreauomyces humboldtii]
MPTKKKSSVFSADAVKQQLQTNDLYQASAYALSAFDNDSSSEASSAHYFAVIAQGVDAFRLRVWDTRTNTLTMEHAAPAGVTCTSVVWGTLAAEGGATPAAAAASAKKRRREGPVQNVGQKLVAIGLSTGEVQLFSLAHGRVVRTLTGVHSAGVADFCFAKDGVRGFSGGLDGLAVEWDVRSGAELGRYVDGKAIKKVRVSHDGSRLLTASHNIKLWSTESRMLVKTYPGHASEVSRLQFDAGDAICVSAADDDRHISVWDATLEGSNEHITSLTMDAAPTTVAVSNASHVLALTEEGTVHLWADVAATSEGASVSRKKKRTALARAPQGVLRIVSSEEDSEGKILPILAATFSDDKILIARGNVVRPVFERVAYLTEAGNLDVLVELRRKPVHSALMDPTSGEANPRNTVTPYLEHNILVLGAADLPIDSANMTGDVDFLPIDAEDQNALQEPTLEERLSALAVDGADSPASSTDPKATRKRSKRPPTATSLHQMLSQAIHTNDVQLLEQALHVNDPDMILATVRRLPPSQVIPLLDQLMMRFQSRPNRARELIEWTRAVVLVHAGYLMSVPHLAGTLGALYQTLDARANVFPKLLKLSGKLDLAVTAARNRERTAGADRQEALYTYDENDEDAESEDEEDDDEQDLDGMEIDEDEESLESEEIVDEDDDEEDEEDVDEEDEFEEDS